MVSLALEGKVYPLWIEASEDLFQEPDFLLPLALLPAMKAGAPLRLPGRVSLRLLSSVQQIQDIYSMWESLFKRIPVEADTRDRDAGRASGVACFFSGGMDSFHTLLKHQEEISHLIYLHRHPPREDQSAAETNVRRVRRVAREMGKPVIEVDNNLYAFAHEAHINWKYYHGAWVASAALLFQHLFEKVLIAGSTTSNYDNLRPQGTHPVLDPLWSTELLEFHHDDCETRRVDKAARISESRVAMKHLQVCDRAEGKYNCGVCKKCLRSMIALEAVGTLKRCETLPDEIDLETVSNLDLTSYSESYFAKENLRTLKHNGADPKLIAALEGAINKGAYAIAHSGYADEQMNNLRAGLQTSMHEFRALKAKNRRLKARLEKVTREKGRLFNHYSSRRYKLADTVVEASLRIPGVRKALAKIRK